MHRINDFHIVEFFGDIAYHPKGDLLLITGFGKYPRGISIGTVEYVNYDRDLKEKTIRMKPSVKFMACEETGNRKGLRKQSQKRRPDRKTYVRRRV